MDVRKQLKLKTKPDTFPKVTSNEAVNAKGSWSGDHLFD
jgi:hypothetical protein